MSSRCPLRTGLYWENSGITSIPEFCKEHCEAIWEAASRRPADSIDVFSQECVDSEACPLEYDDHNIQRTSALDSSGRLYAVLQHCPDHDLDMFAEEYKFQCPYN